MVTQYPDTLIIPGEAANSFKDDNGNWITQEATQSVQQACRYEPNIGNKAVELPDGTKVIYSGIIQMPKSALTVKEGNTLEVINRINEAVITSTVIYFFRGQLHCMIYV